MGFGNVRKIVLAVALVLAPVTLQAQQVTPTQARPAEEAQATPTKPMLQDRLMPQSSMTSNVVVLTPTKEIPAHTMVMASRGQGTALMLTGAALFVAGILINGDAGTFVMVAGAGIGAYGIYLNFR